MYGKILRKLVMILFMGTLTVQTVSATESTPMPTESTAGEALPQEDVRETESPQEDVREMEPPENSEKVCTLNGTEKAVDAKVKISYNGTGINLEKTPVIFYQGEYLVAFEAVLHEKGPKVGYEINQLAQHVELVYQNHVVTFYLGDDYLYGSGKKIPLQLDIMQGTYLATKESYYFVPLDALCEGLGFSYTWDLKNRKCEIQGKKVSFPGSKTTTQYAYSRTAFAKKEYWRISSVSYQKYLKLVTKSKDTTADFKYLRVDRYREVDQEKFTKYYQYLIRDYCREKGIRKGKSSLYGKASVFLAAAEQYQLDPVYLVNQTFLESGYGCSELASGKRIKRVARRGYPMAGGRFRTRALKKSIKVYNLYGIKAYDTDPMTGGTSYAYYHGWTTPKKAIYGAAAYLKENYIQGDFHQNTVFEMRYTYRKNLWHQYATDPYYAEKIGQRMYLMSSCYAEDADFLYDYPAYR